MASVNFNEESTMSINLSNEDTIKTKVADINYIPSYKIAELERQANEKERIAYYNEIQQKVANGEFNGRDGIDGQDGKDGINGKDGEKGEKGESGEKGDKGDTGYALTNTVRGESITIEDAVEYKLLNLEIEGKTVEQVSFGYTNLFDGVFRQGNPKELVVDRLFNANNFKLKGNQSYTISTNLDTSIFRYAVNLNVNEFPIVSTQNFYDSGWKTVSSFTFTPSQDCYFGIPVSRINNMVLTPEDISSYWFVLEEGSEAHSYIPYGKTGIEVKVTNGTGSNATVLELNEPLRSLPNGVKDRTYIKNNKLYVERHIKNNEELATPIIEEVGDCEINTFAGVNNIELEANLKTNFSVTYAQDIKLLLKDHPSMEEIQSYIDENGGGGVASWNDLKDKPFGEEEELTALMDEVKLTDENKHDLVRISTYVDKLKLEEEYLVIYNGTEYRCTAINGKVDNSFDDSILIGNGILADETNTENKEYPFCICNGFYESALEVYWTDDEAVIEVKHIKYITKQLDQKYIPKADISYNDLIDKPFGEEITSYICIPKGSTVLNGDYYYPENGYRGIFSDTKYLVNFNDVEYLCETSGVYNYERYIGNPHYLDSSLESNEYPFCIWTDSYNEMYIIYFDGDVDTTAVISLDELEIEIKQIDTKYIPDTIATTEYVDNLIGNINAELASLTEVE